MLTDQLANALSKIKQQDKMGRPFVYIQPCSAIIKQVLDIMNAHHYIGTYEEVTTARGGMLKVHLLGSVNSCGVIKPRFSVKKDDFVKFEKRYLPANDFGIMIVTTSKGLMTQKAAIEKGIGGRLISYCY